MCRWRSCTVTGADLDIPTEFTLVNPEHVIATVSDGGQLDYDGSHRRGSRLRFG